MSNRERLDKIEQQRQRAAAAEYDSDGSSSDDADSSSDEYMTTSDEEIVLEKKKPQKSYNVEQGLEQMERDIAILRAYKESFVTPASEPKDSAGGSTEKSQSVPASPVTPSENTYRGFLF